MYSTKKQQNDIMLKIINYLKNHHTMEKMQYRISVLIIRIPAGYKHINV